MRRSLLVYLGDIQLAIAAIEAFTFGKNLADYESNKMLQAAVERKFTVIEEAFAQMEHHFPGVRARIDHVNHIVAFRNRLIHDYGRIVPSFVFDAVRLSMPLLKTDIIAWIAELDPSAQP